MNVLKQAFGILKNDKGFIGAAILGAAALGSAYMGYRGQGEANDTSIQLWREQAEYNKPINQMRRFEEAGLNPNLIYGQGNAGNITSTPHMGAKRFDLDLTQAVMAKQQLANLKEQNALVKDQGTLAKAQASVAEANARKQKLENRYFEIYGRWPGVESNWSRNADSLFNYLPRKVEEGMVWLGDRYGHTTNKVRFVPTNSRSFGRVDYSAPDSGWHKIEFNPNFYDSMRKD